MPSGSYVNVYRRWTFTWTIRFIIRWWFGWWIVWRISIMPYLNIYVHPMRADAYHTTGLCGNYNLNRNDDVQTSGSSCTVDCADHRHELLFIKLCLC